MIHKEYTSLDEAKLKGMKAEIEDWKKKHGGIQIISVEIEDGEEFQGIFRVPTEKDIELSTRKDLSEREQQKQLVRLCALYPEPLVLDEIMTKFWGIAIPIAGKLVNLAHITKEAKVKKL